MVKVEPLCIDGYPVVAVEVRLPKTNLLVLTTDSGYVMCGALDIQLLRDKLGQRGIVAARAVGVRTMDELINGRVESCTQAAEEIGIMPDMPVREAIAKIVQKNPRNTQ